MASESDVRFVDWEYRLEEKAKADADGLAFVLNNPFKDEIRDFDTETKRMISMTAKGGGYMGWYMRFSKG